MKFFNPCLRVFLSILLLLFFSGMIHAQVTAASENFESYSSANPISSRSFPLTPPGAARPLVFSFAGTPGVTTGAGIMFLGQRPAGTTIFRASEKAIFFNYTTGGVIPGASSGTGQGDYRIHLSSSSDTSVKSGNFKIQSLYLAIGTGTPSTTIVIQGFRAGRMIVSGEITNLSSGIDIDKDDATNISYTQTSGGNTNGNVRVDFGTNWAFLDGIRFLLPKDIPLSIDDIVFDATGAVQITPGSPDVALTPLNVTGITSSFSWTRTGGADYSAVFVKAATSGAPPVTDLQTYPPNTIFGTLGSEVGSSGWYSVYKGQANSVSISGLTPGITYRAMVVSLNGNTGSESYQTTVGTNVTNFTTIPVPASQATGVLFSNITATTSTLNWTNGAGSQRAVFLKNTSTGDASPAFNVNYLSNTALGGGTQISTTGWYCVFNGTGNSVTVSGLSAGQTYTARIFEYNDNGSGGGQTFLTAASSNNPLSVTTDAAPVVTTLAATLITASGAILNGNVDDKGASSGVRFQYATNSGLSPSSLITGSPATVTADTGPTAVSGTLSGLNPSTVYFYRASGINVVGTVSGSTLSFTTAPAVSSVTASTANGSYKAGEVIVITVVFTSAVTVTGTPALTLNSGAVVPYSSGSGTATLTFNYTIAAAENSADLDYTTTSALAGGTIRDAANNDASVVLPTVGGVNSLGGQKNIVIDTQIPQLGTVTITSNNANNALAKVGDIITLNFTSNETIRTPTATIAGHAISATNVSGNDWTVAYTMVTGDASGVIAFNIVFADMANNAGVAVSATTNSSNVLFDKTAPTLTTVAIVSNNTNTAFAKVGDRITLGYTSSEAIAMPAVTIAGQAAVITNTGGNNWNATYTMVSGDASGAIPFNISFSDVAGNNGTAVTATTNSSSVIFDKTVPLLTVVTITSNNAVTSFAKTGDIVTLNFTSNETITTPTVTIAGNAAAITNVSGNNWSATYMMVSGDATGTVSFNISFSDVTGNAGTAVTATTNSSSVIFDKTVPVFTAVTIASNNAVASLAKTGDIVTLNFTSNETIATPIVTIAGNAATVTNVSGNNWSATYTMISSNATGTVSFNISFSDVTGNNGTAVASTTNSSSVTFDKTIPSLTAVTIASNNAVISLAKTGDIVTLNFTSNEAIATPIVTIAGNAATVTNAGGNNWKAVHTMASGDAAGVISFNISFSDVTGNSGTTVTATTNSSNITFDKTAPLLTLVAISSNNAIASLAKTGDVITVSFASSEAIITPAVTIAGHPSLVTNTGGNNWIATYTMITADASGNVPFNIAFSDLTGNAGTAATATTNNSSVIFDKTIPALTSVTIISSNTNTAFAKVGDIVTVGFTANETIAQPVVTIAGHATAITNVTGNNWIAAYTMVSADVSGTVPFSISVTDLTGNAAIIVTTTTDASIVIFDKTAPSVISINRQSPSTATVNANSVIYRITFSEAVKGVGAAAFLLTTSGATTGTVASVSASSGTAIDITVNDIRGNGTLRLDLKNTGTNITDAAGNTINSGFNSGQVYTIDASVISFSGGATQALPVCPGTTTEIPVNELMRVSGGNNGQTLTWTILSNPSHGTLNGFAATAVINGSVTTPSGVRYMPAGNYTGPDAFTIQVSDGIRTATTTVNVSVNTLPVAAIIASQGTTLCGNGASLTLTASGGNTYNWYNNGIFISNITGPQLTINTTGTYTAKAIDAAGCTGNETAGTVITQLQKPTVDFLFDSYCIGKPVTFTDQSVTTNSGQVTYAWTDAGANTSTNRSPVFTFSQARAYNVQLTVTPVACPTLAENLTKIITIDVPAAAIRMQEMKVAINNPVALQARTLGTTGTTYQWLPATGLSSPNSSSTNATILKEQEYTIAITVASGCVTVDTLLLKAFVANDILLPNIFSPNNDGQNDVLLPNLVGIKTFHYLRIFNRYGKQVFETNNPGQGWDGKVNGVAQPVDTYMWTASGIDKDGGRIYKEGTITLVR